MDTVNTVRGLRVQVAQWKRAGLRVGLVPTMGNLHPGHLTLVARARELADRVVASVFVNPLQFGPGEDFARYPRTLDADCAALAGAGCDLVFAPLVEEMYPRGAGAAMTTVRVPEVSKPLEGVFRPGHFEGVATVVLVLLNVVQPDVAVFGEKDFQQLAVIRRMVEDLQLPLQIEGCATMREPDGLAMSSRNQYLTPAQRRQAPELHAALREIADRLAAGERDLAALQTRAVQRLDAGGFHIQYLEVRAPNLSLPGANEREFIVLAAVILGDTRLIDNVIVRT